MIDVLFKVVDRNARFVGFVSDSLLNLSNSPDCAVNCTISTKKDLKFQTQKYQINLDKILNRSNTQNPLISKISQNIYKKHYNSYKLGDLKVIPMPIKKYLL